MVATAAICRASKEVDFLSVNQALVQAFSASSAKDPYLCLAFFAAFFFSLRLTTKQMAL